MPDVPKPTTGYIVVSPDWDPAKDPTHAWNPQGLKDARNSMAFAKLVGSRKVILKAVTTYTLVEGGDQGGER